MEGSTSLDGHPPPSYRVYFYKSAQRTREQTNPDPFMPSSPSGPMPLGIKLPQTFLTLTELTGPVERKEVLESEKARSESLFWYLPALQP